MLPMTVLRRFDCVLERTKMKVVKRFEQLKQGKVKELDPILNKVAGDGKDLVFAVPAPMVMTLRLLPSAYGDIPRGFEG